MKKLLIVLAIVLVVMYIQNYSMKFRRVIMPFTRRKCDKFGCGNFGASRAMGTRKHRGMDVLSYPGQPVFAPFAGKVRIFNVSEGDNSLTGIEISGRAGKVKIMYVNPIVGATAQVNAGEQIAVAQSLQTKYPGIADHIHIEVWIAGTPQNPTTYFPPDSIITV